MKKQKRGFTLIELLVVVLIIGILAAVAVPQYRIAVQKARLAQLISLVNALYKAEESYYLANGGYAKDLSLLDIDVSTEDCTLTTQSAEGYYNCKDYKVGVWEGPANAQIILKDKNGKDVLSYMHYFADHPDGSIAKGTRRCYSNGEVNRRVCLSLGAGSEMVDSESKFWNYRYTLSD